jgi:hypothetical protein
VPSRIDRFKAWRARRDDEQDEAARQFEEFVGHQLGADEQVKATLDHADPERGSRRALGIVVTNERVLIVESSWVRTGRIRGYYSPSNVNETYRLAAVYVLKYLPGRAGGESKQPARLVLQLPLGSMTFVVHDQRRWRDVDFVADALGVRTSVELERIKRQLTPGTHFKAYDGSHQTWEAIVVRCHGANVTYTVDGGRHVTAPIFQVVAEITPQRHETTD